jgi:hypothetical protein
MQLARIPKTMPQITHPDAAPAVPDFMVILLFGFKAGRFNRVKHRRDRSVLGCDFGGLAGGPQAKKSG